MNSVANGDCSYCAPSLAGSLPNNAFSGMMFLAWIAVIQSANVSALVGAAKAIPFFTKTTIFNMPSNWSHDVDGFKKLVEHVILAIF
jgi:hypothetical protein